MHDINGSICHHVLLKKRSLILGVKNLAFFLYNLNHNVKQTSLPFELTDGDFPTACRFEIKTRQRLPYIELRVSFQNAYTLLLCVRIKLYATIYDV